MTLTERSAREQVAERLLAGSARHSLDPAVEVDWDTPLDPAVPAIPFHRVSLYGTGLWAGLTDEQRVHLSWQEFASTMSVGLWFEMILMQMLLRYAYDRDPRTAHVQYALTEIGDECRHSVMFARAAARLGDQRYGVTPAWHRAGRLYKTIGGGPSMFAAVLVAEETLDRLQREVMADDSMLPFARQICRVHVTEEARHVGYARDVVARTTPRLNGRALRSQRRQAALVSWAMVERIVDPAVYRSVGLDPRQAAEVARTNPHARETRLWMAAKVTGFLTEAGMIDPDHAAVWRRAGLIV